MNAEEIKIKGLWWRQNDPDRKINGEIIYGPTSGARVDLFDHLYANFEERRLSERFVLFGQTFRAQQITLFDCVITDTKVNRPGGISCIIESSFGIVGGHFASDQQVFFKRVAVTLTGLRDWTWTTGITVKCEHDPQRVHYTHQVPDSIDAFELDGFKGQLQFSVHMEGSQGHLTIDEGCLLSVEAETMMPYDEFERIFSLFRSFLSLAVQRPVYALRVEGEIDTPDHFLEKEPVFAQHLVIHHVLVREWGQENLLPQLMLFTLPELTEPLPRVVARFFQQIGQLKSSFDLYLSTVYNSSQLLRAKFLTLAQGVEAYHRVRFGGTYVDDEVYRQKIRPVLWDALPEGLESNFRDSLAVKLNYLHEYSLRKRIAVLVERHEQSLGAFIGPSKQFASRISDLRNALTHPGVSTRREITSQQLWNESERLGLLLEVCFLEEIGFSQDQIKKITGTRSERARRVHFVANA